MTELQDDRTEQENGYCCIQRECRRILDTHTPIKVVVMIRTWYWVVQIMCRDDLQRLFPYQPNPLALQTPLLFELLEAIKTNFSGPSFQYDVNQFIETWRPSVFANVREQI